MKYPQSTLHFDQALHTILGNVLTHPDRLTLTPPNPALTGPFRPGFHYHAGWELFAPTRGDLLFEPAGRSPLTIPAGHILLVPPRCLHMAIDLLVQSRNLHVVIFTLPDDEVPYGSLSAGTISQNENWVLSAPELEAWVKLLGAPPNAIMNQVSQALAGNAFARDRATALLRAMVSAMGEAVFSPVAESPGKGDSRVNLILSVLHSEYYRADLCMEQISAAAGISVPHMANLFKKSTGQTIHQSLVNIRLKRAQDLLRTSNLSVKEIAALTGWSNQLYFSAAFRKGFGHPPSRFRLAARTNQG